MTNKKGSEIKAILVSNDGQYIFLALGDKSIDMINYQGELVHKFENVHRCILFEYGEMLTIFNSTNNSNGCFK